MASGDALPRLRNKRGEGGRLREDIINAAGTLLEETGRDDAVTLRAVARIAGITAPSIYAHFADADEIRVALVERRFSELAAALRTAAALQTQPVPALHAVCGAYVDFAEDHPDLYRVLFQRLHSPAAPLGAAHQPPRDVVTMIGSDAFGVLLAAVQACIENGDSDETSAQAAAVRVWVSLHGMVTLRASLPWFPWAPRETLLGELLQRAADLHPGSTS